MVTNFDDWVVQMMTCSLYDRPSCLPADYAPLCSRHYLLSVEAAKRDAAARFEAHVIGLMAAKNVELTS